MAGQLWADIAPDARAESAASGTLTAVYGLLFLPELVYDSGEDAAPPRSGRLIQRYFSAFCFRFFALRAKKRKQITHLTQAAPMREVRRAASPPRTFLFSARPGRSPGLAEKKGCLGRQRLPKPLFA